MTNENTPKDIYQGAVVSGTLVVAVAAACTFGPLWLGAVVTAIVIGLHVIVARLAGKYA